MPEKCEQQNLFCVTEPYIILVKYMRIPNYHLNKVSFDVTNEHWLTKWYMGMWMYNKQTSVVRVL